MKAHSILDTIGNTYERSERNQLGDLTWCVLTNCVSTSEYLPWVFLSCL